MQCVIAASSWLATAVRTVPRASSVFSARHECATPGQSPPCATWPQSSASSSAKSNWTQRTMSNEEKMPSTGDEEPRVVDRRSSQYPGSQESGGGTGPVTVEDL